MSPCPPRPFLPSPVKGSVCRFRREKRKTALITPGLYPVFSRQLACQHSLFFFPIMNHCAKQELFWHHKFSPGSLRGTWPRQPFRGQGSHHFPVGFEKALALQPARPRSSTDRPGSSSAAESSQELAAGDLKLFFILVAILTFLISVLNFDGQSGEREKCYSFALKCETASSALTYLMCSWDIQPLSRTGK